MSRQERCFSHRMTCVMLTTWKLQGGRFQEIPSFFGAPWTRSLTVFTSKIIKIPDVIKFTTLRRWRITQVTTQCVANRHSLGLADLRKFWQLCKKHTTTFTFTAWWRGGTNTSLFAMQMDVGLFSLSKVAIHALANFSFISELKFCFSCIHIVIFGRSVLACINIGYTLDSRWLRRLDHRGNRCIDVPSATSV